MSSILGPPRESKRMAALYESDMEMRSKVLAGIASGPDREKELQAHKERVKEITKKNEDWQDEQRKFWKEVLAMMQRQNELLAQIAAKLGSVRG